MVVGSWVLRSSSSSSVTDVAQSTFELRTHVTDVVQQASVFRRGVTDVAPEVPDSHDVLPVKVGPVMVTGEGWVPDSHDVLPVKTRPSDYEESSVREKPAEVDIFNFTNLT
ncbi:unnamed protein product [Heligmosomoides polygyrus]|uniref:SURF1-like protein n=1 Tax=Heligmosomoides polygyrus TaxID=6339 RepID=A0A3P8CSD5_HELPZ|nr:unnamed protein product [Heligmosomoides polygyrus]